MTEAGQATAVPDARALKLVLIGDGDSPHLLKWARALAATPHLELWAASSRGFAAGFDAVLPAARRLALATTPRFEGGNIGLLRSLPRLVAWLRRIQPDWLHAHYLTSHGTLAQAAVALGGVRARIAGSAWGSDILVTPERNRFWRRLTRGVLQACALTTSDSLHMAERMRLLGAGEVMVLPFGLEALPPASTPGAKRPGLFFTNRGLEAVYAPHRVIAQFQRWVKDWPADALGHGSTEGSTDGSTDGPAHEPSTHAAGRAPAWPADAGPPQLVIANDGALAPALQAQVRAAGLERHVRFVGRLDAAAQTEWYAQARWFLSLPRSDAVSVSVLEAMAHGCVPLLSDLPANRELVRDGDNGLIVPEAGVGLEALQRLAPRAGALAEANRAWVAEHAMFAPAVAAFVGRLRALSPPPRR